MWKQSRHWLGIPLSILFARGVSRTLFAARVVGHSMLPTLREGDWIVGFRIPRGRNHLAALLRNALLSRGAVVLVRPPAHLGRLDVKRVDGVPGDLRGWGWDMCRVDPCRIPANHVFLLGNASRHLGHPPGPAADSRQYGPCPTTAVVARVVLRFRPTGHGSVKCCIQGSPMLRSV